MAENWNCQTTLVINYLYLIFKSIKIDHWHNLYVRCSLLAKQCLRVFYIHKWVHTHIPLIPCTGARYKWLATLPWRWKVLLSQKHWHASPSQCNTITQKHNYNSKLHNFEVRHPIARSNNYYVNEQSTQLSCVSCVDKLCWLFKYTVFKVQNLICGLLLGCVSVVTCIVHSPQC
jgi:hypothetical protein